MQSLHLQVQLDRDRKVINAVSTVGEENGDVRRLALAGIGAGAARLVDRDGDDLQDRRETRKSAVASWTAHIMKWVTTHGLHDAV